MSRVGTSPGQKASSTALIASGRVLGALLIGGALVGCGSRQPVPRETYGAYIDRTGAAKIRSRDYEPAGGFSEGLARVSRGQRFGFIDSSGRVVIEPRFGWVDAFSEGLAVATDAPGEDFWKDSTLFGYIDRTGKYVTPPRYNWAARFSEGVAGVCRGACRNGAEGWSENEFIDRTGKTVLAPDPIRAGRFSEGLASARSGPREKLAGYIDRSGKMVIAPGFAWARDFSEGLAATDRGFIDRSGRVAIPRDAGYEDSDFSEGLAAVAGGRRFQYIDSRGTVQLEVDYSRVGPFSEGLAPACRRGCGPSSDESNWGYIDRAGRFVIEPRFAPRPGPFRDGLALVRVR